MTKRNAPPPPPINTRIYFEVEWSKGYWVDVVDGYSVYIYGPYFTKKQAIRAGRKKAAKRLRDRRRKVETYYREDLSR